MKMKNNIFEGDVLKVLKKFPDQCVNCIVTSPPYWGLRDYGVNGQLGLERTPKQFIKKMVRIFREARRVLRKDGTLWLNIGDSYANSSSPGCGSPVLRHNRKTAGQKRMEVPAGIKPKDLIGIPWMMAFALRADGWYLRSDIIWQKPNPMPESVSDRPTKAHEYLFLLSRSRKYYYDNDAIREPLADTSIIRLSQNIESQIGSDRAHAGGKTNGKMKAVYKNLPDGQANIRKLRDAQRGKGGISAADYDDKKYQKYSGSLARPPMTMKDREYHPLGRNKRTVWTVATQPYKKAHFATFPQDLIKPCILAGCPKGGVVLDPFMGSGTTAEVSRTLFRYYTGIELNPEYIKLANKRLSQTD